MGPFLVYILKSSICLAAFYLFYRLLLSRETFYRFNRFALLGILAYAAVLPLVQVGIEKPTEVGEVVVEMEDWIMEVVSTEQTVSSAFSWVQILLLTYLAGIVFFLAKNLWSLARLLQLLRSGKRMSLQTYIPDNEDITLIVLKENIAPFSWMRYIVVSEQDLQESPREILIHECAHIRHHHSWDLLLADVCIFFQWFNPAAWLLKQELQIIHEYEADANVLREGVDARGYQLLLIRKAVGGRLFAMANNLNQSNLKKRITMMLRPKSHPWARLKYAYVLPLAAVAVAAFARPEVQQTSQELAAVSMQEIAGQVMGQMRNNETTGVNNWRREPLLGEGGESSTREEKMAQNEPTARLRASGDGQYTQQEEKKEQKAELQEKLEAEEEIVQPQFPGGDEAMLRYVASMMRYPREAQDAGVQGRLTAQFVVNEDGSISDVEIVNNSAKAEESKLLEEEAIRVISSMPRWQPATQGGVPIKTLFRIPVTFRLQGVEESQETPAEKEEEQPDKGPVFPGGDQALVEFLAKHMEYPADARAEGVQGRVTTQFVVEKDGSISHVEVIRSVHPSLDAEAVRVVSMLPDFEPAIQDGVPVAVRFRVPITFRFQ